MSLAADLELAKKFENHLFQVHIAESYDWTLPREIRENKIHPVFDGGDSLSYAKVPMIVICDMINNDIEFEVYDYHNFFLMREILLSYRFIMNQVVEPNETVTRYIRNTDKPLAVIKHICDLYEGKNCSPEELNADLPMVDILRRMNHE